MKIGTKIILTSLILFFITTTSLAQTDTTEEYSSKLDYDPQFSGAHAEFCLIPIGFEIGCLTDIDLIRNKKSRIFSLGFRISLEYYTYGNPGGGGGTKYFACCFYARPALKFGWFWINALGGFTFHGTNKNKRSEVNSRYGLELKFNVFRNYIGLMLKGSISPFEDDYEGFVGIGVSIGYFN